MTRIHTAVFTLAAGIITAGMTIPNAAAQSAKPSAQFMPGQPVAVTVSDYEFGTLEIVWAGRVPLEDGSRVRLALPNLGQRGLAYAVVTQGLEPDAAKKHQSAVGRVHTVFIPSPGSGAILGGGGSSGASPDDSALVNDSRADGLSSEMEKKHRAVAGRLRPVITSAASGSGATFGGSSGSGERDSALSDGRRNASSLSGDAQKKHQSVVGRKRSVYLGSPVTPLLGAGGGSQAAQGDVILTIGTQGITVDFGYDLSDDIVWDDPCVFGGMKPAGSAKQVSDSGASLGDGDGLLSGSGADSKNVSTSTGTTGIAGA